MILYKPKKSFLIDKESLEMNKTVSTLLIPEHLLNDFYKKVNEIGSVTSYIKYLLKKSRMITFSGMLPPPLKVKTEFQEEGLRLSRINFRVHNEDWLELGELAVAFGKSRCYLVSFLLELDILGFLENLSYLDESRGVPTIPRFTMEARLKLNRSNFYFARIYYVRI